MACYARSHPATKVEMTPVQIVRPILNAETDSETRFWWQG
ncbi:hypothetical protein PF010_g14272 [Phytophthora fragariae]|uniref:Uncharacterized protein n=1 Tax=Phytophthora fragariae TaxID=53985 RepID=A0A6A3K908_9STRA|nr:hypothetical protein PF011_g14098 [Phytophthora fragariae]KAE9101990.1 hypothetical protein PF010_g14272 [Phytophthora fragariae]